MYKFDISLIKSYFDIPDNSSFVGCVIYNHQKFKFFSCFLGESFGLNIRWTNSISTAMVFDYPLKCLECIDDLKLCSYCTIRFLFNDNGSYYWGFLPKDKFCDFIEIV